MQRMITAATCCSGDIGRLPHGFRGDGVVCCRFDFVAACVGGGHALGDDGFHGGRGDR